MAKVVGYTASRSSVDTAKVTYKRKNQTIKVTYKKNASASNSGSSSNSSSPSKPTNSGSTPANKSFTVKANREITTSQRIRIHYVF